MNGKEFKETLKLLNKEKGIQEETVYEAMELALTSAYKKQTGLPNVRVDIDRETGDILLHSLLF